MPDKSETTTFWGDNPIAHAAKARIAELDWINASNKVEKLRRQLADAERKADLCRANLRSAESV